MKSQAISFPEDHHREDAGPHERQDDNSNHKLKQQIIGNSNRVKELRYLNVREGRFFHYAAF